MDPLVKPENDSLNRNVRRYQVRLKVTATGVLIFAFWNVIRNVMMSLLKNDRPVMEALNELWTKINGLDLEMLLLFILTLSITSMILLFDILLRVRIFVVARRESGDPQAVRKKSVYVMAVILMIGSLYTMISLAVDVFHGEYDLMDVVISIILEFTSLVTLIELIYATAKLRRLRDEQNHLRRKSSVPGTDPGQAQGDHAEVETTMKGAAAGE